MVGGGFRPEIKMAVAVEGECAGVKVCGCVGERRMGVLG